MKKIYVMTSAALMLARAAYGTESGDQNLVNIRIVCAGPVADCTTATTKLADELQLQKQPAITLADIRNATAEGNTLVLHLKNHHVLHDFTTPNVGKKMAVLVEGSLLAEPVIAMPISGDKMSIPVAATQPAQSLADDINKAINLMPAIRSHHVPAR